MFRLFECCALSFFERFVLSFSLKIERFVSDSAEIWICGLYIDINSRKPILSTVTGGLSGSCIKPVALRMVWQTYKAVKVPIIGLGGISSWQDAIEFFLAGATAIQIGTYNFIDPTISLKVINGINSYLDENGFSDIQDLTGALGEI